MAKYLVILLLLAGCTSVEDFASKYNRDVPPIEHRWEPYRQNPTAWNGTIYIDDHYFNEMGKWQKQEVLKHESGHVWGLGHCKKWSCLMYYRIWIWPKGPCNDCKRGLNG